MVVKLSAEMADATKEREAMEKVPGDVPDLEKHDKPVGKRKRLDFEEDDEDIDDHTGEGDEWNRESAAAGWYISACEA